MFYIYKIKFRISLKIAFVVAMIAVIIFTTATLPVFFVHAQKLIFKKSLESKMEEITRRLADLVDENSISSEQQLVLQRSVRNAMKDSNDVICVAVYDKDAVKLAESKKENPKLESFLSNNKIDVVEKAFFRKQKPENTFYKSKQVGEVGEVIEYVIPVISYDKVRKVVGASLSDDDAFEDNYDSYNDGNIVGLVRVVAAIGNINKEITKIVSNVSIIALFVMLMGVLLTLMFVKFLLGPIDELIMGTKKIADGDLSYNVPLSSITELRSLAKSFNIMSQRS